MPSCGLVGAEAALPSGAPTPPSSRRAQKRPLDLMNILTATGSWAASSLRRRTSRACWPAPATTHRGATPSTAMAPTRPAAACRARASLWLPCPLGAAITGVGPVPRPSRNVRPRPGPCTWTARQRSTKSSPSAERSSAARHAGAPAQRPPALQPAHGGGSSESSAARVPSTSRVRMVQPGRIMSCSVGCVHSFVGEHPIRMYMSR